MRLNEYMVLSRRTRNSKMTMAVCLSNLLNIQSELFDNFLKGEWLKFNDSLGDMLWNISQLSDLNGSSLEKIAENNIKRLIERFPVLKNYGTKKSNENKN